MMYFTTTELLADHSQIILPQGGNPPRQSVERMWAGKETILVSRQLSI